MDSEKRNLAVTSLGAIALSIVAYMAYQAGTTEYEPSDSDEEEQTEIQKEPVLTDEYTE